MRSYNPGETPLAPCRELTPRKCIVPGCGWSRLQTKGGGGGGVITIIIRIMGGCCKQAEESGCGNRSTREDFDDYKRVKRRVGTALALTLTQPGMTQDDTRELGRNAAMMQGALLAK